MSVSVRVRVSVTVSGNECNILKYVSVTVGVSVNYTPRVSVKMYLLVLV